MRCEARLKAGYYPCQPFAIDILLKRLETMGPPEQLALLDPCAGEGAAIAQIAAGLGVPDNRVWMVELDPARGDKCRERLPGATILAPCSFLQSSIRNYAYSLCFANPPFDDSAAAGRRVEEIFLSKCVHLVAPQGILVFVCPEYVTQRPEFRKLLLRDFGEIAVMAWPSSVRKYQEVFVIARRRDEPISSLETDNQPNMEMEVRRRLPRYPVPPAKGPGQRFTKNGYTDDELLALLERSPLKDHLRIIPDHRLPAPPLSLGVGHLALLLSAGHLDGLVTDEHGISHVVRGTARKVVEVTDEQVEKTKSATTVVRTETERISLIVRAVWPDGEIHTLGEEKIDVAQTPA
jgi:hypothetical protein